MPGRLTIYRRLRGVRGLRYFIEVLKLNGAGPPKILRRFSHSASSLHMVRETMKLIMDSPEWPSEANGFRIVSETGAEVYR